jgi:ribosomal protein S2
MTEKKNTNETKVNGSTQNNNPSSQQNRSFEQNRPFQQRPRPNFNSTGSNGSMSRPQGASRTETIQRPERTQSSERSPQWSQSSGERRQSPEGAQRTEWNRNRTNGEGVRAPRNPEENGQSSGEQRPSSFRKPFYGNRNNQEARPPFTKDREGRNYNKKGEAESKEATPKAPIEYIRRPITLGVERLIEVGANLGHNKFHASMTPFIYGYNKLTDSYQINMDKTMRALQFACDVIHDLITQSGYSVVWLGDNQLPDLVKKCHSECQSYYIPKYWGGVLTNFSTKLKSIHSYNKLSQEEEILQKSMQDTSGSLKSALPAMKAYHAHLLKEKKKIKHCEGLCDIKSIKGKIFIACSLRRADKIMQELTIINSRGLGTPSYLIAIADSDADISEARLNKDLIFDREEFKKSGGYLIPIPGNDDKISAVEEILKVLVEAVIDATPGQKNV